MDAINESLERKISRYNILIGKKCKLKTKNFYVTVVGVGCQA